MSYTVNLMKLITVCYLTQINYNLHIKLNTFTVNLAIMQSGSVTANKLHAAIINDRLRPKYLCCGVICMCVCMCACMCA